MHVEAHNHGPQEGKGTYCRERRLKDGTIRGACMKDKMVLRKYIARNNKKDTVQAVKMTRRNAKEIAEWCDGILVYEDETFMGILIKDRFESKMADEGDHVILDVVGFWSCTPAHFKNTFKRHDDYR